MTKKTKNKRSESREPKRKNPLQLRPTKPQHIPERSCLRFTATAWAKLLYVCHRGDTEIGGFGVCGTDDLLLVDKFCMPKQQCTAVNVAFDDESVADYFEEQVAAGRGPEQFGRVWIHTHPGNSPSPSAVDEETFARVFGGCDWAVMFILARSGATYARLRFNTGPGGEMELPVEVDFSRPFAASDHEAWQAEYLDRVHQQQDPPLLAGDWGLEEANNPFETLDDLGLYDEVEADLFMEMTDAYFTQ